MKNLLAGFALLTSTLAFGHVEGSDPFVNIGKIESIKTLSYLNIKPNTTLTHLGGNCHLKHNSVNYDRYLPEGTILHSEGVFASYANEELGIKITGLKSVESIWCYSEYPGFATIDGIINGALKDSLEIKLADPVLMD